MTKTLQNNIAHITAYVANKYDASILSQYEACRELLFKGKELSEVLDTKKLPSLNVKDVARFIVLHT